MEQVRNKEKAPLQTWQVHHIAEGKFAYISVPSLKTNTIFSLEYI